MKRKYFKIHYHLTALPTVEQDVYVEGLLTDEYNQDDVLGLAYDKDVIDSEKAETITIDSVTEINQFEYLNKTA